MQGMASQNNPPADVASPTVTASVGKLDALELNTMKMADVGGTAVALVRTSKGVFALDNACPHQGYGLTTGALIVDDQGEAEITCQWHNWKFRADDGVCTIGEEDVACHRVEINDQGDINVSVTQPSDEEAQARLWPSLRRGFENDYMGQVSRDSIRLLDAGATPAEIMGEGVRIALPKHQWGPGHDLAMAADCLALAETRSGDDRVLPLIQGLSGLAEETRDRPIFGCPAPDSSIDLATAVESEDANGAMAAVLGMLKDEVAPEEVRRQLVEAACQHHLGYGHGAIYTQKSFEMLDRLGWDKAEDVLPYLARTLTFSTREDTLPYMSKFMKALEEVDLDQLAGVPDLREAGWQPDNLVGALLEATEQPLGLAVQAINEGAGIEGLLDAISLVVSHRLLRYDTTTEQVADNFGWLDISHGLTYARAARWAWRLHPSAQTARLVLFCAWLAHDTGRLERRRQVGPVQDKAEAVVLALEEDPNVVGDRLANEAMDGRAGSFIVVAHLVKMAQAAREEAAHTGSSLPLAAAARLIHEPRRERFIARNVTESLDFIRTGRPPKR